MKNYLKSLFKESQQVSPASIKKFSRHDLIFMFHAYKLRRGAEIGVAEGRFSEAICQTIKDVDLLCVDNWTVTEDKRSHQIGQGLADHRYHEARERLKSYNCKLVKANSFEAVQKVPDGSLDFVYIDASHEFDNVMLDLIFWSRKVRIGGIVALHDYYHFKNAGVVTAVNAYTYAHGIIEWFLTDERTPTAFWMKEK